MGLVGVDAAALDWRHFRLVGRVAVRCIAGPAHREPGKPTQTLTVGTNIPFTTLDPNTINTSVFPFRNSVFDPLITIPVTDIPSYKLGSIQNELATAYTVNKDVTEIRMRVRDGVTFPRRHPDDGRGCRRVPALRDRSCNRRNDGRQPGRHHLGCG